MEFINFIESIKETPVDPEVGTAIVPGIAEAGISMGLAVVQGKIRPHYQKISDEIYFIVRGQGELTVGNETKLLREGEAASIPKGKVHTFKNTGPMPCLVLFASGPKFEPDKDRFFPE